MSIVKLAAQLATIAAATFAFTTAGTAIAAADPLDYAGIGTCLHIEQIPGEGGTVSTSVKDATCGTPYANIVIRSIAGDKRDCPNIWIADPDNNRVLCADEA